MAAGLAILAQLRPGDGVLWMIIGSTVQSIGAGLLFTPHSTFAFATLAPELRTDASGVFSLLRQLGCACGVALMTAVRRLAGDAPGGALAAGSRHGAGAPVFCLPTPLAYRDRVCPVAAAGRLILP